MHFDLYVRQNGWLHRLDPRTKLMLTLVGLVISLIFQQPVVLTGLLLGYHLLLFAAGVPWSQIRWLWGRMLPLTVMILLLQPFFASQTGTSVLWQVGPLRWTWEGVMMGVMFALRVNSMAIIVAALLFTTEPTLLVRGLVKIGLPYEWGLTVSLAIRYLPTTYGLYLMIYESQQARGWEPGKGNLFDRARSYLPMLVAVMIAALKMADNLGMALAARGFGAPFRRTTLRDIHLQSVDWMVMILCCSVLFASIIVRFS